VNTEEPTLLGHVASDPSAAVYTVTEVFPEITDVYVFGTDPKARYTYSDVNNPKTLVIEGRYFNQSGTPPTVDVYLCSEVTDGEPSGTVIQGTVLSVVNNNTIVASFDFTGQPSGFYKVLVRNRNDSRTGWTAGAPFELLSFSPAVDSFTYTADGFYENYYDIPSVVTGACLDGATAVTITNGSVEYDLAGDYSITGEDRIDINLNLINCSNSDSWKLRVYFDDAHTVYREKEFDITLGPAKILPRSDSVPAIRIYAERGGSTRWNNETTSANAYAWDTYRYWFLGWIYVRGYATFEVRGKGFPLGSRTNLRVWGTNLDVNGLYNTYYDRANKVVRITSARWEMPLDSTGLYNIEVYREGDAVKDTYNGRWELRS
jgi:hypothetical protein